MNDKEFARGFRFCVFKEEMKELFPDAVKTYKDGIRFLYAPVSYVNCIDIECHFFSDEDVDKTNEIIKVLKREYENFNENEYVKKHINLMGIGGVPSTVSGLLKEARKQKKIIKKWYDASNEYYAEKFNN